MKPAPTRQLSGRSHQSSKSDTLLFLAEGICWIAVVFTLVIGIYGCFTGSSGSIISINASRAWGIIGNLLSTAIYLVFFSALAIVFGRVRSLK